ncbi:MAG TPA: hypothetical protein PLV88_03210, partial [Methanoregulaceae archaeon]|nr:hypothetical protein [Methanoregulaceae archaeon]
MSRNDPPATIRTTTRDCLVAGIMLSYEAYSRKIEGTKRVGRPALKKILTGCPVTPVFQRRIPSSGHTRSRSTRL